MIRKLFTNARIVTPVDTGRPGAGEDQGLVRRYENGMVYCVDGIIEEIGNAQDIEKELRTRGIDQEIDCGGLCMIPGFVDPHTHMCFAARREDEFSMRLRGASYMEIHNSGGGILSSVKSVRESSEEDLFLMTLANVESALSHGTTTVEIKSGYGLDTENELKMLRVIRRIALETPLDVAPTFMGAHAVPEEFKGNPDGFVDLLVNEMIPAVREQGIADFIDVFCEEGVFSLEQSRKILEAGKEAGFKAKIHADEVVDTGGAGLAADVEALSAEHLLAANEENISFMAEKGVMADLLPGTAYSLRKDYAPARKMIARGVPVALASDCNPGSCFTESMPFVFGLAVMNMNMSPEEALVASTLNAAYAIDMAGKVGSLEKGKKADLLLLDGGSPTILAYHAGVSPVAAVFKLGEPVA
jgi:imidazolonepropionase